MAQFLDTAPTVVPVEVVINHDQFSSVGSSVLLTTSPAFSSRARLLDVTAYKEIAFDGGAQIALGSGAVTAQRETMATAAEIDAGVLGVSKPGAWAGELGFGQLMVAGNTSVFAYLSGGLPTVGRIRLILSVIYLSPRTGLT